MLTWQMLFPFWRTGAPIKNHYLPANPFFRAAIPPGLLERFRKLPKIDLHRHREGSIRLGTLLELASEIPGLPFRKEELPRLVALQPEDAQTTEVFLGKFGVLRHFYVSKEIIQRTTQEVIEDAAADGVVYLELRVAPAALTAAGAGTYAQALDWVWQASRKAEENAGIQVQLVALMNRHESLAEAARFLELIIERKNDGYCGIDLAGDELHYQGREFIPLFEKARESGLGVSVHAGEWGPAENIQAAILEFRADRIGHGVRVLESPETISLAIGRQIPFEVCLTSNVLSGVAQSLGSHPVGEMMKAGLQVTLNTDDPAIQQTTLSDELALAVSSCGLSSKQVGECMLNAAWAAYLPEPAKAALLQNIQEGWKDILLPDSAAGR